MPVSRLYFDLGMSCFSESTNAAESIMDHSELISSFSAITGADANTAQHFLAASNYDLNTSTNFFFESGGPSLASEPQPQLAAQQFPPEPEAGHGPVSETRPSNQPETAQWLGPRDEHDNELQAALAASLRPPGALEIAPAAALVLLCGDAYTCRVS